MSSEMMTHCPVVEEDGKARNHIHIFRCSQTMVLSFFFILMSPGGPLIFVVVLFSPSR